MSSEMILNSMGYIDEELIADCDELRKNYYPRKIHYGKWISVAACLLIVSAIGIMFMLKPVDTDNIKLSGIGWWRYKNPITFTERPEREQVVVIPTGTPEPTVTTTIAPTDVPVATVQSTEIPPEPTETGTDWEEKCTMFLAMMEPEYGKGICVLKGSNATSSNNNENSLMENYSEEFFIENSVWTFEFSYNNGRYIARKSSIIKDDINQYMGDVNVDIYETNLANIRYTKTLPMYSINNISTDAAIAIKISEDEYYLFLNNKCKIEDLVDYINSYDLRDRVTMNNIGYLNSDCTEYVDIERIPDSTTIWDILLSVDATNSFIYNVDRDEEICIEVDSDFYGFYDMAIYINNNGNINIRFFGQSYLYNIGEEGFKQIYNLLKEQ